MGENARNCLKILQGLPKCHLPGSDYMYVCNVHSNNNMYQLNLVDDFAVLAMH